MGDIGQIGGEVRGAGATGEGWRLGSGIPGACPHSSSRPPHTSLEAVRAELGDRGWCGEIEGWVGGAERAGGARGGKAEPRWSALGRPSLLGSEVRRHPGLKAAAAAAAADRRSQQTLPFANLFAVWACCT